MVTVVMVAKPPQLVYIQKRYPVVSSRLEYGNQNHYSGDSDDGSTVSLKLPQSIVNSAFFPIMNDSTTRLWIEYENPTRYSGVSDDGSAVSLKLAQSIANSAFIIICIFGFLGNGMVIRLLGFHIKRNPFTTYILNLSIADFGVLAALLSIILPIVTLYEKSHVAVLIRKVLFELFFFTYSAGQFLLTAISIDRSVAVLFPLWHRCHRPPRLSTIICSLIWSLSFLLSGIHLTLLLTQSFPNSNLVYQLIVNALICTPLMVTSTLILTLKVCCKSVQKQRGKLLTTILLTLLFFLIFAFPLNAIYTAIYFNENNMILLEVGFVCASLNSSVNPVIYFLVGRRQKKCQSTVSMKVALQRIFQDEEESASKTENLVMIAT
ncbi:mas-related G-protein coupled receptor member H-like [Zootoca vivipara]|uniref:mas-related G-protein coupled receptor member H-like n=1 Tax=Zootoca vivipara TaxID=8524 RepID=UPI00293BA490|nr:mas-related G-protein coupled receptor member H-like [Zootoca vivipara]